MAKKDKQEKQENTMVGMVKFVAHVLLKEPSQIGIVLDDNGWTDVDQLILNSNSYQQTNGFELLTKEVLDVIVAHNDVADTKFEYSKDGWMIRAVRTTPVPIVKAQATPITSVDIQCPEIPPDVLYHGTVNSKVKPIMAEGLKKMKRTHVYLCSDHDEVKDVAVRHAPKNEKVVILTVKAKEMYLKGHKFFKAKGNVWMTDNVPSTFIVYKEEKAKRRQTDLFSDTVNGYFDDLQSEVSEDTED